MDALLFPFHRSYACQKVPSLEVIVLVVYDITLINLYTTNTLIINIVKQVELSYTFMACPCFLMSKVFANSSWHT